MVLRPHILHFLFLILDQIISDPAVGLVIYHGLHDRAFLRIVGRFHLRFPVQHIEHRAVAVRDSQPNPMLAASKRTLDQRQQRIDAFSCFS